MAHHPVAAHYYGVHVGEEDTHLDCGGRGVRGGEREGLGEGLGEGVVRGEGGYSKGRGRGRG